MSDELGTLSERIARIESGMAQLLESNRQVATIVESVARMQERQQRNDGEIGVLFKQIKETADGARKTDAEVKKWVNRGIGAYTVASVCCALLIYIASNILDNMKHSAEMITSLDRRVVWIEHNVRKPVE